MRGKQPKLELRKEANLVAFLESGDHAPETGGPRCSPRANEDVAGRGTVHAATRR